MAAEPIPVPQWPLSPDLSLVSSEPNALDLTRDHLTEYDPDQCKATPQTVASLARLSLRGIDARVVYTEVVAAVTPETQLRVNAAVATRELAFPRSGLANDLFNINGAQGEDVHTLGRTWYGQSKRAHALLVLSDPTFSRLGGHAGSSALETPMFSGRNAVDVLNERKPGRGEAIATKVASFLDTMIEPDGVDTFGLTSHEYLAAVPDSIAIRKREATATEVIRRYAQNLPEVRDGKRGLKIASLACGAGNMMCQLVPNLAIDGVSVERIDYYDQDPLALAVARAHADGSGIGSLVNTRLFDLIKGDSSQELKDFDIKEMLGLFEYLKNFEGKGSIGYHLAQDYLRSVGKDMKPGSMILFGNMVDSRPHQTMFNQVWPRLVQRSPEEVVDLIVSAGYPPESVSVSLADDGVYAVYSITIPEGGLRLPRRSARESLMRKLILSQVPDY